MLNAVMLVHTYASNDSAPRHMHRPISNARLSVEITPSIPDRKSRSRRNTHALRTISWTSSPRFLWNTMPSTPSAFALATFSFDAKPPSIAT